MERLTFEGNFCDIAQCDVIPGGSYCESGSCTQRKVWERLAAYEDTGLTPERCAEFARADAEGRYIVMRDTNWRALPACASWPMPTRMGGWWCCRARCAIRCI